MKKLFCVMLTVILTLSLFAGCGAKADDGVINVAIIQQLDHSSLDEIRLAIEAELDKIAAEDGLKVKTTPPFWARSVLRLLPISTI